MSEVDEQDQVQVLTDPEWTATEKAPEPPIESVVGIWPFLPDGERGRFIPNPAYRPAKPGSPLDPVDAALRLIARGEAEADLLPDLLRGTVFSIAVDEAGAAIVRPAPDGVPSALITTAFGHRDRVPAAGWRPVTLSELAEALPRHGVDVLLNPGAPASMRLLADAVRAAAAEEQPAVDRHPGKANT